MIAVFSSARGKLVLSHASAKFSQRIGFGHSNPVPAASCSGVFRATTTARYSGTRTVSEQTAISAVAHQLVLRVRRRGAPAWAVGWRDRDEILLEGRRCWSCWSSEIGLSALKDPELEERDDVITMKKITAFAVW